MKFSTRCLFAMLALGSLAHAATDNTLDLATRYNRYYETHTINTDGTAVESYEWSRTVLKQTALEWSKSASVSYSTSAQKAEVVSAYTLKKDGRRIDVPKDNYQVQVNSGKDKDAPVYSDSSTLSVIFPELEVGDSTVFSYKVTQTEPMFPKHYSEAGYFGKQVAYDDLRVRFDYPAAMWVQYEARNMQEAENTQKDDRKVIEWRYSNPQPVKSERRDYSVFDIDKEVGYAFSTFRNHADIATAYGSHALPKAAVTTEIQQLADDIVKGTTAPKDQARALYTWVATNITYAGNCVGIGGVVPRDTAFVIKNKMGDCKDHATLLQALLAARGIKSTQALVNASSVYQLPRVPVVSTVNHVINYLPDFNLFVDSTSDTTPFGLLPFGDQDKPVLLVEGYKEGLRTPAMPKDGNRQQTSSVMKFTADGSISSEVEVSIKGLGAASTRAWARNLSKDNEADYVKNALRSNGYVGNGQIIKDDPTELLDTYHYKIKLNAEKYLPISNAGALPIFPPFGIGGSILAVMRGSTETEKEADVVCFNGHFSESFVIELPPKLKVLSIPNDMQIKHEVLSYNAKYKLKGNTLSVTRTLDDRTKGNTCSPAFMAEYKKVAEKVTSNLKEQLLYK